MSDQAVDLTIRRLREEISELDRSIVEAVNRRLELVARLKRHKAENGIPFVDPERERAMLEQLSKLNAGPLSEMGVRELQAFLLDLTKRELRPGGDEAA